MHYTQSHSGKIRCAHRYPSPGAGSAASSLACAPENRGCPHHHGISAGAGRRPGRRPARVHPGIARRTGLRRGCGPARTGHLLRCQDHQARPAGLRQPAPPPGDISGKNGRLWGHCRVSRRVRQTRSGFSSPFRWSRSFAPPVAARAFPTTSAPRTSHRSGPGADWSFTTTCQPSSSRNSGMGRTTPACAPASKVRHPP